MTQIHNTIRKDSELGSIPQEWEVYRLGEISEIKSGKSRPKEIGEYPVYGGNGILDYANEYNIDTDSIIIGRVGAYCGCVYLEKSKFRLSDNALGLVNNEKSDIRFLYYLLKHLDLNTKSIGGAQPLITQGILKEIEIPLPPLHEQQAIASVLGSLDDKIEVLREQNRTLEKMGQTMFYEWFGKYSIEDKLPEGWRVGKLGEELVIKQGKYLEAVNLSEIQTEEKKYPVYGGNGIRGYIEDFMYENPMVVLTCRGNGCGLIQFSQKKSSITNSCMAFENMNSLLSSEFIYFLSKKIDFESATSGSAQPQITVTSLYNLEIIIPDQETLKKFEEVIQQIFAKIRDNSEQIQSLAHARDNLLPRLMSGKLRIF